ncbi:VWA domain-containing protein [Luedemannella flava]|uniref:VWA domain-containing protein n=1 Tax=Luedemannella flava TaxID=349316 RepID=A0ABN2MXM8_9ACTN
MRTHRFRSTVAVLGVALLALAGCSKAEKDSGYTSAPRQEAGKGADSNADEPGYQGNDSAKSTFAIDIDTASYTYARRLILDGRRPYAGDVRAEEFVNAFKQDYPQPYGSGFTVNVDGARLPGFAAETEESATDTRLLRIGLQTRAEDESSRRDAALTFVIDTSGSMSEAGRLDLVQDALHTLVDQLRGTDAVAIVAYESRAKVLRPMTPVSNRRALHAAIDDLSPGGSTNLEDGLVTGYQVARDGFRQGATNRVILLSDGLANVGATSAEPILRQVREAAAKQIALLGVGVGSDYGDQLMEQLADSGDGFVTYVSEPAQARELFVHQLPATLTVRARDAKAQVTFDRQTVASFRLVGYENRSLAAEDFRDDSVDGGEVGPGHSVTALYLVRLRPEATGRVAQARVRWLDPVGGEAREAAAEVRVTDLNRDFAATSPRLRVDYAAAGFAEALRGGTYSSMGYLRELATVADAAYRDTSDPQVAELAQLIRSVR